MKVPGEVAYNKGVNPFGHTKRKDDKLSYSVRERLSRVLPSILRISSLESIYDLLIRGNISPCLRKISSLFKKKLSEEATQKKP
ncbi:hypothetical protein DB42_AZ00550 [Neochlamydia sp. EPS4]|uniref:hypothetical protein n=1 Tax=Neochlamydia sp. EPS4 TaxID=1478175 RepID=UPI000582FDEF|nr:hypothetical protein [Neochlamydia sp. EPS4]KIC74700.1 hypothetical protein DB42_AZ00550 [Neochlamydia sp. EPS4]